MNTPIKHAKGTDQTVSITIYFDGEPIDWTDFTGGTLTLHIHSRAGVSIKDVALTSGTFPTSTEGITQFTLSDSDFSSTDVGEYVWFVSGTSLTGGSGVPVTGEFLFDSGRFILYAPDSLSVKHS